MDIVNALKIDRDLVLEFLAFFARFEYALKRGGYASGNEKEVNANWDTFAQDLRKLPPDKLLSVLTEGSLLLREPPKRRAVKSKPFGCSLRRFHRSSVSGGEESQHRAIRPNGTMRCDENKRYSKWLNVFQRWIAPESGRAHFR